VQKYIGELYSRIFSELFGLKTVSLRYFNVYGPRQHTEGAYAPVMGIFLRQKAGGERLTVTGDGEQTRDFTHVSDVVKANILALESEKVGRGEVINIGAGKNYSVNAIAKFIGGEIQYLPARPGEILHTLADITLAKKLLDWEPKVDMEEGIKQLLT
ncbi:MAG: GDP-mannose 4,6-dehydratase, partial [bacterium]|nr:GDP-mannose 4,6-dehydratase [bacterium]